ncbi:MAG: hypothetical protein JRI68_16340 [Deltaproteobacteria bacterium]|nr:hypothetical protein [Deltaproteobacteria bacterium]
MHQRRAWLQMAGTAPAPRHHHTAVWIQSAAKMIVWGGQDVSGYLDTGGEFDSANNQWVAATPTAPEGRSYHTAVTAGDKMMVWGGEGSSSSHLAGGAVYTPQ